MTTPEFRPTRRSVLGVFAALGSLVAAPVYARSPGFLKGAGDIRRIRMYSQRTGESLDAIYYVDGKYIPEVLNEITYFMRDWRQNKMMKYDARNIDNLAATLQLMDTDEPYLMISGYRTPQTNRILKGAAKDSFHMKAMAADVRRNSRKIGQITGAAVASNGGGGGLNPRSHFLPQDCGPVRSWRG